MNQSLGPDKMVGQSEAVGYPFHIETEEGGNHPVTGDQTDY